MSRTEILEEIRRMPEAERRELVESIALEFGDFDGTLLPGEAELIDQRLQEHHDNPKDVVSLEEVRSKLDVKYRK